MSKPNPKDTAHRLLELVKRKQQLESKNGVLGKDLSSKYSSGPNRAQKPTKRGGRNGQGKP